METSAETKHKTDVLECLASLSSKDDDKEIVFTPPKRANEVLDLLPEDVWHNKSIKFLDPCCKSGVFLREIAVRLYSGLKMQIPDDEERKLHILKNQIYGIATDELRALVARRTIYCSRIANGKESIAKNLFSNEKGNIMQEGTYQFIHSKMPKEFKDMEFDVIIGNPPYQRVDGGHGPSAMPIYNKFVEQAKKMNPKYIAMIIPSRWFSGGRGLDSFRRSMLNDTKISKMVDYPNAKECFPENDIKGGICYFLWDEKHSGKCELTTIENSNIEKLKRSLNEYEDIFIRDARALPILEKIKKHGEQSLKNEVSTAKPFGMRTYFKGEEKPFKESVKVYQNQSIGYVKLDDIDRNQEWIFKHKVIIPYAGSDARQVPDIVLAKPMYAGPNTACTETYIVIGTYKSKTEAENAISYIKTKFFRFLVSKKKITQHGTRKAYEFVPMQDFSKPWTDKGLYSKYKLTSEEVEHIEKSIKVME